MRNELEAILFDIDGTLIDSNDAHARAWVEAFARFGKTIPLDEVRRHIGKGGDLLVPDLLDAREMRRFGEQVKEYRSTLYKETYMPHVRPFPQAREHLEEIHRRGIRIALASSSNPEEVDYCIRLLGVGPLLAGSTSKGDAKFSKPSPEIFEAALERTGSDPARTLVVGDTPYDILAAHRIALPIAAVLTGGFEPEALSKAEFLFRDIGDLIENFPRIDRYFAPA